MTMSSATSTDVGCVLIFFAASDSNEINCRRNKKKEARKGTHIMEPEGTNDQSLGENLEAVGHRMNQGQIFAFNSGSLPIVC
jgi:hypothetical protein